MAPQLSRANILPSGLLRAGKGTLKEKGRFKATSKQPEGSVSTDTQPLALQTCVVPPLHGAMMIAHSIQVIDVVLRVPPESIGPSPRGPMRWQAPAALASLNHMRCHVQASQRELDHVLKFHAPVSFLLQEEKQVLMTF